MKGRKNTCRRKWLFLGFSPPRRLPRTSRSGGFTAARGSGAHTGSMPSTGVELAVEQINAPGIGGKKLDIIYENDDTSTEKSVTAPRADLWRQSPPSMAILGPEMSSCIFAVQK